MREFNITGNCVPHMHYMVDIKEKIHEIKKLVDKGRYFTINRARQYGKTTTRYELKKHLIDNYIVINISFEGIGDTIFSEEKIFTRELFNIFADSFSFTDEEFEKEIRKYGEGVDTFKKLSKSITTFCKNKKKKVILMIDEVDKSSNNQLFLNFLGMLRDKYLARNNGEDLTFYSVILLSVYDVKNLKLKIRQNEEKKLNSPWNIATQFEVDMSFNPREISSMLIDYEKDFKTNMNINEISEEIYNYTGGHPFLVSKICKVLHEKLDKHWTKKGIEGSVKIILDEKNTLFDDLIKNLENFKEIYNTVYGIVVEGKRFTYNSDAYEKEIILGILSKNTDNSLKVHNKIFEIRVYNYMIAKREKQEGELITYEYRSQFIKDNKLDMQLVLSKFQEVMHDEFRDKDTKFLEREGRLLFLCFLKPIINGKGFYYVEPETRMDNRMDIVVAYGEEEFIIELKIWYGENYKKDSIEQLAGYLESKRKDKGYLVSFNFNKNKEYTKEGIKHNGRDIFAIVV